MQDPAQRELVAQCSAIDVCWMLANLLKAIPQSTKKSFCGAGSFDLLRSCVPFERSSLEGVSMPPFEIRNLSRFSLAGVIGYAPIRDAQLHTTL
jgi:hypothetical protein